MNVLCVSYEYPPLGGGGGPVCQGLCEALVAAGHRVDVVTSAKRGLPLDEVRNGVGIHRHWCVRRHMHYATVPELVTGVAPAARTALQLHGEHPYDLVHCHFIVPSGLVARWIQLRTGLPYILTAHGSDVPGYNPDRFRVAHRAIAPIWKSVLRNAAAVTTPSEFLGRMVRERVDVPIEVIPNGYSTPPFDEAPRQNRVLAVTRMFERKGVQHLIDAMRNTPPDWSLHVVGDGPYLPVLRERAAKTGVEATFHGYVRGDSLAALYRSAKIFVLPSLRENFPVVLLEAMAAGCAVVTTSGTGCVEVVGSAGVLVEPGDATDLHRALVRLMGDEQEVCRLRALSLARSERFAWPAVAGEFERLFQVHAHENARSAGATWRA